MFRVGDLVGAAEGRVFARMPGCRGRRSAQSLVDSKRNHALAPCVASKLRNPSEVIDPAELTRECEELTDPD